MFKVGDHVKVIKYNPNHGGYDVGHTGVITNVYAEGLMPYEVDNSYWQSEDELELDRKNRYFAAVTGYTPVLPTRATKKSAGYDICMLEDYTLAPEEFHKFPTGLKVYMPDDEVFIILPRSSLGIKGLFFSNTLAIIDADFADNVDNEGHIQLILKNHSNKPLELKAGQKIAQGIFMKYGVTDDDDVDTERCGGCGSTD